MTKQYNLKEIVKHDTVTLQFYRKGELHYTTSSGFNFVVPIEDCGDGTFNSTDGAMFFMRYIRKQFELNEAGMLA
mgnify:CR=1 FL=1